MSDIVYISAKISSRFNIKDETPFQEKQDLVQFIRSVWATEDFNGDYASECGRRLQKRVKR